MKADRPNKKIDIKVPEYYKSVSDEVWVDLEKYIFSGFITASADILGKSFVFKTLNHMETSIISYLRPANRDAMELHASYRAAFIAHSVFLLDGENTLYRRPVHIGKLTRILRKLSPDIQLKIMDTLQAINEKAYRLHPLTEVYVHENRSRYKWLQLKGIAIHSPMATGIAGTDEIGMNYCQQTWTVLSRLLEEKDTMDREWSNAKFIGSCFAGKGIRAIDERDRSRREKERSDRDDLKMKVLYTYLNRGKTGEEGKLSHVTLPDGRQAEVTKKFQALSVEELADQLSAALSGEKDHHDLMIERKISQIQNIKKEMEGSNNKMYRGSSLRDNGFDSTSLPLHGSSRILGGRDEAEAHLSRMRKIRDEFLSNHDKQTPQDLENYDEESGGGDNK